MNDNVRKWLLYTGIFGASITAIAYLVVTYVIVMGFTSSLEIRKQLLFSILGAFAGLMITFFLRSQGIVFAKQDAHAKEVMKVYYEKINKKKTIKQLHTITYWMTVQTILDIFRKGITVASTTFLIIYVFMEGNGDYSLFALALSNMMMFACFGLIGLSQAYDKYLEEHIPVIQEIIKKIDQDGSIHPKELEDANL